MLFFIFSKNFEICVDLTNNDDFSIGKTEDEKIADFIATSCDLDPQDKCINQLKTQYSIYLSVESSNIVNSMFNILSNFLHATCENNGEIFIKILRNQNVVCETDKIVEHFWENVINTDYDLKERNVCSKFRRSQNIFVEKLKNCNDTIELEIFNLFVNFYNQEYSCDSESK